MAITLKRQLNDQEKAQVLEQHGRRCFANGHGIPEGEQVQFDHIVAFSKGGLSELDNVAPMCAQHNKEKGALPLQDFRVKLRLEEFFKTGDRLTLGDLLGYLKGKGDLAAFGQPVAVTAGDGQVTLESPSKRYAQTLYTCPTTGWRYFYATLDVDVLGSDDDQDGKAGLQPRYLIFDKVFQLYRHFQRHPVLQPSVGRLVGNHVRLFDGQHKAAALLWNGRRAFECKVYLDPDLRLLNQTNISAHDNFAQTRFFSSVMVMKLGGQFGADFERYKVVENGEAKTEAGFMAYLAAQDPTLNRAQLNQRFRSYLYDSVLQDESNKSARFVSAGNRGSDERPLTIDVLSKSLFACLVYREPTDDDMATAAYQRDDEMQNVVSVMNDLYDLALDGWDAAAPAGDERQRRLGRTFRSKAMMAWAELLRDAVCGKLDLQDAEDRARPMYRTLSQKQRTQVRGVVGRLVSWKRWDAPDGDEVDRVLADNKGMVKEWLRGHGLTTGYLMGAPE